MCPFTKKLAFSNISYALNGLASKVQEPWNGRASSHICGDEFCFDKQRYIRFLKILEQNTGENFQLTYWEN